MNKKLLLILLFFIPIFLFGQRKGIPPKPEPARLVNNLSKEFPNFISSSEEASLEEKLENFATETSNQIVVIIVDDLNGYEPYDFATELGQQWQVGQEKEDNGVIVLIKPTGGPGERKTFIAVGRGLEGAIPDLTAKRIVDNELIPNFKEGNFYKGIDAATTVIMELAKGEYNHKDYGNKNKKKDGLVGVIIIILVIILIIRALRGKGGGGSGMSYGSAGYFAGRSYGSSWGSSSSSSGGFGGFGGGSFGGGGSGGSW